MRAVDLIVKKRDGGVFAPQEIDFLVAGFTSGGDPGLPIRLAIFFFFFFIYSFSFVLLM